MYVGSPIKVEVDDPKVVPSGVEFEVYCFGEDKFRIIAEDNSWFNLNREARWGDIIHVGEVDLRLQKTNFWPGETGDRPFYFTLYNLKDLTKAYRKRLKVEPASLDATILTISLEGIYPEKDRDFLLKLTEVFQTTNLDKKNQKARRNY